MDPLSEWMEENGLSPSQDTGTLPPAGGYALDPNAGNYAYEVNEGMFQGDGAWDQLSMWEVERYGVLNFNAMEGVSFMGQAEQTMASHANYLYNGGSSLGFGTIHGGMTDRHGWFPGMRVTDDGKIVATSVTIYAPYFHDDDSPQPANFPKDDDVPDGGFHPTAESEARAWDNSHRSVTTDQDRFNAITNNFGNQLRTYRGLEEAATAAGQGARAGLTGAPGRGLLQMVVGTAATVKGVVARDPYSMAGGITLFNFGLTNYMGGLVYGPDFNGAPLLPEMDEVHIIEAYGKKMRKEP